MATIVCRMISGIQHKQELERGQSSMALVVTHVLLLYKKTHRNHRWGICVHTHAGGLYYKLVMVEAY